MMNSRHAPACFVNGLHQWVGAITRPESTRPVIQLPADAFSRDEQARTTSADHQVVDCLQAYSLRSGTARLGGYSLVRITCYHELNLRIRRNDWSGINPARRSVEVDLIQGVPADHKAAWLVWSQSARGKRRACRVSVFSNVKPDWN